MKMRLARGGTQEYSRSSKSSLLTATMGKTTGRLCISLMLGFMVSCRQSAVVSSFHLNPLVRKSIVSKSPFLRSWVGGRRLSNQRFMVAMPETETSPSVDLPEQGADGLYHCTTGEQHKALLEANKDKLVILKVFAPWCRACKGLEPKFVAISKKEEYEDLPMIWASLTIQNNKDYVKSIGVLALPTVQFYVNGGLADNFPCGPSKIPILKRKLTQLVNDNIDPTTLTVTVPGIAVATEDAATKTTGMTDSTATLTKDAPTETPKPAVSMTSDGRIEVSVAQREKISKIPYLSDLSDEEREDIVSKGKVLSFETGSIIMREGGKGRSFYIILDGEVEVCQRTSMEDPLTTPSSYLGTVINRLEEGDFFGERAIITGEPRAASIRAAASGRTRCLILDQFDFPATSVLSGKTATQLDAQIDEKYGVSFRDTTMLTDKSLQDAATLSQVRGSANRPGVIDGVDNDNDSVIDLPVPEPSTAEIGGAAMSRVSADEDEAWSVDGEAIIPLLMRFKMIRLVTRCFDYIMKNRPSFGDVGSLRRRSMYMKLLQPSQIAEFKDAYDLIDANHDGEITLMELRRLMESVGEEKTDDELSDLIKKGHGAMDGKEVITYQEFLGIMAEAECYHLFLDTFRALDKMDSGFVRASDLDRVLCGVRDLVSDDRKSIIDVEDKDILIDYERFSQMLLGTALR